MAVARGTCPNCGAPAEFSAGASVSKVCPFCRHVIVRTDREWAKFGKAADLANTPSRIAVGDRGTVRGTGFEILGRLQMDYGKGPWDEFYASFSDGTWGWISEAQGNIYVTRLASPPIPVPSAQSLEPERRVQLGAYGSFKVAERRGARVLSAEGELPFAPVPQRVYADLNGPNDAFATIDYGDGTRPPEVFIGAQIPISELQVTPRGGERPGAAKVKLQAITCPNCGGALPAPSGNAIERVACKYCNAISDLASLQVIARQAAAYAKPKIPIGSSATLTGAKYTVIGYVERSAMIEGEHFRWYEYLLFSDTIGFRWLVEDEGNWLFVRSISNADVEASGRRASWHGRHFEMRNDNTARVDYVLGEFYWKVEVGERVAATDFVSRSDVLSREIADGEVQWSYGTPLDPQTIARAFGLAPTALTAGGLSPGGYAYMNQPGTGASGGMSAIATIIIVLFVLVCVCVVFVSDSGSGGSSYTGSSYGGGYSGGSGGFGGFGGK